MLDERAFIQAIAANPDDDGPRLMFADYLDERGDPNGLARAEFIRVQCALAQSAPPAVQDRLWEREQNLLEANWRTWLRPICQALGEPLPVASEGGNERHALHWLDAPTQAHMVYQTWSGRETPYFYCGQFRRGFFAHAALVAKPYRGPQHVARLVERTPLDGLTLIQYPERELRATLAVAEPQQLRSLELLYADAGGLEAVTRLRGFSTLRELVVRTMLYQTDVAEVLSVATVFQQLRTLCINSCAISEEGLQALLQQPWVARLERLEIIFCRLTDRHAQLLFQQWPANVRHVDLSGNHFTNNALQALRSKCDSIHVRTPADHPWPERFYW